MGKWGLVGGSPRALLGCPDEAPPIDAGRMRARGRRRSTLAERVRTVAAAAPLIRTRPVPSTPAGVAVHRGRITEAAMSVLVF